MTPGEAAFMKAAWPPAALTRWSMSSRAPPGEVDEVGVDERMALAAEAVEPVGDVGDVARLAHLAVADDVGAALELLGHDLGDRFSGARLERDRIDGDALLLGEHGADEV